MRRASMLVCAFDEYRENKNEVFVESLILAQDERWRRA